MAKVFDFRLKLFLVLLCVLIIHTLFLYFLGFSVFSNYIILAYIVNYILAVIIYIFIYRFRIKYHHLIGFLFMFGSFLKFLVFFLIFHPKYLNDGKTTKFEFAAFFIPYISCLIFETKALIKILNVKSVD